MISQITIFLLSRLFHESLEANSRSIGHAVPPPDFYIKVSSLLEFAWILPVAVLVAGAALVRRISERSEDLVIFLASLLLLYGFFSVFIIFLSGYIWTRHWVQH